MFWHTKRVYLDYAAGAEGNPSSPHEEGRRSREMLEGARVEIARLVEAKPDDVIFTSGATEANNLAIRGFVRPGSHVLYLPSAHASVVESVRALEGVIAEPVPIANGRIDVEALVKLLRPATTLVALEAVCGETGTVWNTREVAQAVRDTSPVLDSLGHGPHSSAGRTRVAPLVHVDASQAPMTQKISRSHFGADMLTLDAQKVGGIRGAGVLIAPRTIPLQPILFGGGQERGLRSGTPAPALAASFAAALRAAAKGRERFVESAAKARQVIKERILKEIPNVYINEGHEVAPNILNLSLPGRDTDYLVTLLDTHGFAVSTKSACETDSGEGSRAVFALTHDKSRAESTVRISWGPTIRLSSLERFVDALVKEVRFIDKGQPKSHY